MASINTNRAALQALQAVNAARSELAATQRRVSTGLKVAGPKDNGAIFAIAQNMRAEIAGWRAVGQSLARAHSAVDVAAAASATVTDLLVAIQEKARAYADNSLSAASRSALRADIEAMARQIDRQASTASFDGINLVNGEGVAGTVLRTPMTTYRLASSPLTPQSFMTPMHAGSASSSWSAAMTTRVDFETPYSALTPDGFAAAASMAAVSSATQINDNRTIISGTSTLLVRAGDDARRIAFHFDAFTQGDVIEVWQGATRVAASGWPYAPGGAPADPGLAVAGRQVIGFDYDPANGTDLLIRINPGGAPPGSTVAYYGVSSGPVGDPPDAPNATHARWVTSSLEDGAPPSTPLSLESAGAPATNGIQTHFIDAGTSAGRVDMLFDASVTPDVVEVWQNGARVAASGQAYAPGGSAVGPGVAVAGAQVISFDYDPSLGQTLEFRFNENNPQSDAAWVVGGLVLQNPAAPLPTADFEPLTSQSVRVGVVDETDFTDPPPPLTPELGVEESASKSYVIDAGANAGRVDLAFEAYDDDDVVEVWQGGVRVAASGRAYASGGAGVDAGLPVTGRSIISFDYDPANGQALEFRFNPDDPSPGAWTVGGLALNAIDEPAPASPSISGGPSSGAHAGTVFPKVNAIQSPTGGSLELSTRELTAAGLGLASLDWSTPSSVNAAIDAALAVAIEAGRYFGNQQNLIGSMLAHNDKLAAVLEMGVGNLVDADVAREAAKLQAGQVRQQLAMQSLSIANAAPAWILTLFGT